MTSVENDAESCVDADADADEIVVVDDVVDTEAVADDDTASVPHYCTHQRYP
jgi:hypothetical protein